jgi:hypothetical protein
MELWLIFVISFVLFSIGGGIGWFLWYKAKPKARTWIARCYTLSEGIQNRRVLEKKRATNYNIKLKDLKPYTIDTLKKITGKTDTIYKLVKQNLTTGAVTADMVDYWGKDKREVNVLISGDTATLMKKSFDYELGEIIFRPMDRERIEMIKSEMAVQTARYEETKGLLASVLPWVAVGFIAMALVATAYFQADVWIKTGDKMTEISLGVAPAQPKEEETADQKLGKRPAESKPPPDIE